MKFIVFKIDVFASKSNAKSLKRGLVNLGQIFRWLIVAKIDEELGLYYWYIRNYDMNNAYISGLL